jgi:hypothetical protein
MRPPTDLAYIRKRTDLCVGLTAKARHAICNILNAKLYDPDAAPRKHTAEYMRYELLLWLDDTYVVLPVGKTITATEIKESIKAHPELHENIEHSDNIQKLEKAIDYLYNKQMLGTMFVIWY